MILRYPTPVPGVSKGAKDQCDCGEHGGNAWIHGLRVHRKPRTDGVGGRRRVAPRYQVREEEGTPAAVGYVVFGRRSQVGEKKWTGQATTL